MLTGLVKKLKEIRKGNYQIVQVFTEDKQRVLENDKTHMDTFISQICKDKLERAQKDGDNLVFEFEDDPTDYWTVIPSVELVEYDYKISEFEKKDGKLISQKEAERILEQINCTGFVNVVDKIEKINMVNWSYSRYILKNLQGRVLAKVDDKNEKAV